MTLGRIAAHSTFQFHNGRPVLIDTLSFEIDRGEAWVGYRQFCEHFLAPLALVGRLDMPAGAAYGDSNVDGVPIDLAARLLPWRSKLNSGWRCICTCTLRFSESIPDEQRFRTASG